MRVNQAFVIVIVVLSFFAFYSVLQAEEYKESDLPFVAVDLAVEKGGEYSEPIVGPDERGDVKPSCTGISLKALKLGDHEIPLKSTAVTSDCMIETKDYGSIRIKLGVFYPYIILVTPEQEKIFKELILTK